MNQSNHEKIVNFRLCRLCKYWDDGKETSEKCHDCLENPVNIESERPVNYIYDEEKKKKPK